MIEVVWNGYNIKQISDLLESITDDRTKYFMIYLSENNQLIIYHTFYSYLEERNLRLIGIGDTLKVDEDNYLSIEKGEYE